MSHYSRQVTGNGEQKTTEIVGLVRIGYAEEPQISVLGDVGRDFWRADPTDEEPLQLPVVYFEKCCDTLSHRNASSSVTCRLRRAVTLALGMRQGDADALLQSADRDANVGGAIGIAPPIKPVEADMRLDIGSANCKTCAEDVVADRQIARDPIEKWLGMAFRGPYLALRQSPPV